ncbi:hypothetical protein KCU73_g18196, partial [Aureobasidium melanogenum]
LADSSPPPSPTALFHRHARQLDEIDDEVNSSAWMPTGQQWATARGQLLRLKYKYLNPAPRHPIPHPEHATQIETRVAQLLALIDAPVLAMVEAAFQDNLHAKSRCDTKHEFIWAGPWLARAIQMSHYLEIPIGVENRQMNNLVWWARASAKFRHDFKD